MVENQGYVPVTFGIIAHAPVTFGVIAHVPVTLGIIDLEVTGT